MRSMDIGACWSALVVSVGLLLSLMRKLHTVLQNTWISSLSMPSHQPSYAFSRPNSVQSQSPPFPNSTSPTKPSRVKRLLGTFAVGCPLLKSTISCGSALLKSRTGQRDREMCTMCLALGSFAMRGWGRWL